MSMMECRSLLLYLLNLCALVISVTEAKGILDLSITPTYALEYQRYHISIFKDASGTSEPTFYYTPACLLLRNGTSVTAKTTNPLFLTVKIGLWDEEYTRHIRSYLIQRTGIQHPDIRPVPFKWLRIDGIDNWQISQTGAKWKYIGNHPQVSSFRVRCWTSSSCDKVEPSLATDSEHFASTVHLAFAYRLPNATKSTIKIQRDHLQASGIFRSVNGRYPEANFVYMQQPDFEDLVNELLQESIIASVHHDEFVDDEQIDRLLIEYSAKLLHNSTSTAQFTEAMWDVTFWTDESQRPDVKAKDLEALFSSGRHWLKRIMRGDNVTSEAGISESSPTVAAAIAELRAGTGHVQWSGSGVVIRPFKLWCVDLGGLREKTDFGESSIWTTKRTADYLTPAHFDNRNSAPEAKNSMSESGTDYSYLNQTYEKIFQMIGNLTGMVLQTRPNSTPACKIATPEAGIGINLFNQTLDKISQMFDNLTGLLLQSRLSSASESNNATVEIRTGFSHASGTILQMIGNLTDTVLHSAPCRGLEPKRLINTTWLIRDADTLWSLNHTRIAATVRSMLDGVPVCPVQQFTATSNPFGEILLSLPKRNGLPLVVTFEVAGYYPITVRNVHLDTDSDTMITTFMEPLLFISRRFAGSGTAAGTLYDVTKNKVALSSVKLDFRTDVGSHSGTVVESVTTSADGTWSVTLPVGHCTVTASTSGYITMPFTVAIIGGKSKQNHVTGLSPILDNGAIRVVLLWGVYLSIHVRGPIESSSERSHTNVRSGVIPGSFVRYEDAWWGLHSVLIWKQLTGVYRISISDWWLINTFRNGTLWDMANSDATVQVYTGDRLWAQYFVPNRIGNAWSVVDINGTHLKPINEVATVTRVEDVN